MQLNYRLYIKDRCEICGTQEVKLCVHHIDSNRDNNSPDNLQTRCFRCHRKVTWQQIQFSKPKKADSVWIKAINEIIDIAKISRINQITIPKAVRELLKISPDDILIFKKENGKIVIEKA